MFAAYCTVGSTFSPEPQFEGEFQIVRLQLLKSLHIKADLKLLQDEGDYMPSISALNFFADFTVLA